MDIESQWGKDNKVRLLNPDGSVMVESYHLEAGKENWEEFVREASPHELRVMLEALERMPKHDET